MGTNLSEFISNNVYLNKLINNKIKKGKKGISIKIIHDFLSLLNNYKYEEILLLNGYKKGNIYKKYKRKIRKLTINYLLLHNYNFMNSNIKIKRKYLLTKVSHLFKRITPVILMNTIPLKRRKLPIILPVLKRNNKSQINKSIRFFIKHTSLAKKGLRRENILKSFINEYKGLKKYTSKCIKEKLNLYRTLNLNLFRFRYRFKYKKL
jgi:hypothetical protein